MADAFRLDELDRTTVDLDQTGTLLAVSNGDGGFLTTENLDGLDRCHYYNGRYTGRVGCVRIKAIIHTHISYHHWNYRDGHSHFMPVSTRHKTITVEFSFASIPKRNTNNTLHDIHTRHCPQRKRARWYSRLTCVCIGQRKNCWARRERNREFRVKFSLFISQNSRKIS